MNMTSFKVVIICLSFLLALTIVECVPKNLTLPEPKLCAGRKIHTKLGDSGYYVTWLERDTRNLFLNWLDARNWCRERCMDLISLESSQEIQLVKKYIDAYKIKYCWTSGRLCDFGEKCTSRKDLQPLNINGWFWSGSGQKMRPTNEASNYNDWSQTGGENLPCKFIVSASWSSMRVWSVDDNREKTESCVAYLNNYYKDGIKWHDVGCHHIKSFICEDSPTLLQYARSISRNSGLRI